MAGSDILVIGAGVVGCSIAHELASRGARVAVIDERNHAAGATQASGGMLAPFSEAADDAPLLDAGRRSLDLYDTFVARVTSDSGQLVTYTRTGTLHVAQTEPGLDRLMCLHRNLATIGVAAEAVSPAHATAGEPALGRQVLGGLLIPGQGLVSATQLTDALRTATRRLGGRFLDPATVTRVSGNERMVRVETSNGVVEAYRSVLAAGAWCTHIVVDGAECPVPVRPVRGQLLHLGWPTPQTTRIVWSERCYTVPWPDGTLLVGATVEDAGFDQRTTVAGVHSLTAAVADLFPGAADAEVRSVRAGLRPATPDGCPIIGWSESVASLFYATGHYRNGVLLAPLTAAVVADAILDNRLDPSVAHLTRPARFGRI